MGLFNFPIPQGNIRVRPLEGGLQAPVLALAMLGLDLGGFFQPLVIPEPLDFGKNLRLEQYFGDERGLMLSGTGSPS